VGRNDKLFEQQIWLTVLSGGGWSGEAKLVSVKNGIATVHSTEPVKSGAAIRIDSGDALMVGECRGCRAQDSQFETQITLKQIIPSVTDLARLVASIIEASPRSAETRPAGTPIEAHTRN